MWYWYVSNDYELFLDVDRYSKCIDHIRQRLQGAHEQQKLLISQVRKFPSTTLDHYHIIITLRLPMPVIERAVWETILHSDIYRSCCNIMRALHHVSAPTILIAPKPLERFREHDAVCICPEKHSAKIMANCEAAEMLRGENRTKGFFGKPSKNRCIWL